jgi:adenylate cyclase
MRTRRLAAVLAADVVGYARLMSLDEDRTHERLKSLRTELIEPQITQRGGRAVKWTGDGVLAEFGSVTDGVLCALDVQAAMSERNRGMPDEQQIRLRIGISVGDLIIEDDDIFGNGVNIAARLEAIAEPGGICISGIVHDEVRGRLALNYQDAGELELKNIARPVRVYRISPLVPGEASAAAARPIPPPLPDTPSLAVLPFDNMSGDPDQEYFADGMVEDILTALSRIEWLFVIARNSSFTYKGRAVDIKQVGRELGVRYVLEGSVRKSANRVRINAQLIETAGGAHIWAERFDGSIEDVFELQDQVTASVCGAIEPRLRVAEIARSRRKPTESMHAYDYFLQALANFHLMTRESTAEAVRLAQCAIALDQSYSGAYALAAQAYAFRKGQSWMGDHHHERTEGLRLARLALRAGMDDATALTMASLALSYLGGENREAAALIDRALRLNPNLGAAWNISGWIRVYLGEADLAIEHLQRACRLSPLDPLGYVFNSGIGFAHFIAERYEETITVTDWALREKATFLPAQRIKVAALGMLGRLDEARASAVRLLELEPGTRLGNIGTFIPWEPALLARYAEGLRRAGVPA